MLVFKIIKGKKNQELLKTHNTKNGCEYTLNPKVKESFEKKKWNKRIINNLKFLKVRNKR